MIIITANDFLKERQQCLQAGANNFIAKPFELDNLFDSVEVLLLSREN
ncbi:MAG: hypothetical protein V3V61_07505 [Gammaproteobacteria bacterium]